MTSGLHTQQEAKRITYDPFISAYKKKYSIKEMGEIKLFIKIAVSRNRVQRTITLSQETYITEMVPKPDISYNVSLLCRFSSRPSPEAWRALVKDSSSCTTTQLSTGAQSCSSALPYLTENMGVSKKSEHFRRWQHFLRYLVTHNYTYMHLCRTTDMLANPLTKCCNRVEFQRFAKTVMNFQEAP